MVQRIGIEVRARRDAVEEVHNAGESENAKATSTAKMTKAKKLRVDAFQRVPKPLRTTRSIPGGRGGAGEVGGALAAERLAGSGDEDAERVTWAKSVRPRHQDRFHTSHGCYQGEELEGGGLTGAGDEEGPLRPQRPKLEFPPLRSKPPEIELGLGTTEARGWSQSRDRRLGAAGIPPSPWSSKLGNGGRGDAGRLGALRGSGCKRGLRGA